MRRAYAAGMDRDPTGAALAPRVTALVMAAPPPQRQRLLNALLRPLGPLALVSVAAGAFSGLLPNDRWRAAQASREQTMGIDAAQVLALVVYVEQKSPELLLALARNGGGPAGPGPSAAADSAVDPASQAEDGGAATAG